MLEKKFEENNSIRVSVKVYTSVHTSGKTRKKFTPVFPKEILAHPLRFTGDLKGSR